MKNKFKVVRKENKEFVLQEEKGKNRFFLFWMLHKKNILVSLSMIFGCILLVVLGISLSSFRGSNDYDITYVVGDDEITINPNPDIDDEDVKDELLGEIAREDGIVLLTETILSSNGDVISYFTDRTAIVVTSNGKIYRISSDAKGNYGVNKNGKIDDTAKKILVNSNTTALSDGTVITNYSDGTAKVELKENVIFVRDSNNIELLDGNSFVKGNPSGVSLGKDISRVNNFYVNKFTDGTTLVIVGDKKYIVNKNRQPSVSGGNVYFDRNNSFESISEKTYTDGFTINHYSNGSATITDKNGNVTFVRKSGDLVLKKKQLYEILPSKKGVSRWNFRSLDGTLITYFNNGGAVIIKNDGTRIYVEDADQIVYDRNKNIESDYEFASLIGEGITDKGEWVYNFDNGKSQVINKGGKSSYIVDTDSLDFKPITDDDKENPEDEDKDEDEKEEDDEKEEEDEKEPEKDPGEGIYISEAENIYNDFKNVENTKFIIKNNNTSNRTLRIAIEEVSDYRKYNTSRLDPKFVKFQATVGDAYVPTTVLSDNTWIDSDGVTNYIIYDGVIGAKQTVDVTLALYVDYSLLNNSHQNKGFVGTIKIYVES